MTPVESRLTTGLDNPVGLPTSTTGPTTTSLKGGVNCTTTGDELSARREITWP
jgi:hypothetical protein